MSKATDVRVTKVALYFLPVETRVPLKFGPETLTAVTCARVCVEVTDREGTRASGWGETPLSVQWVWPSSLSYGDRHEALKRFTALLAYAWARFDELGHPIEISDAFQNDVLPESLRKANHERGAAAEPVPWLAALVCCSPYDIALHDAYGQLRGVPVYATYGPPYMNRDLSAYLQPAEGSDVTFEGKYPQDFLRSPRVDRLVAWHLVGGLDPLDPSDLTGDEPDDGYPVLLADWTARDGLKCLKVKLRGDDPRWDYERLLEVGEIAIAGGVDWLSSDFNCTVTEPGYVNAMLYVEQPFPYDLEQNRIDGHSVSARKPLFMDESAHDWRLVRLGRALGWTGVALKTCKTQTGALLALCWAKAHGMTLMVQDLTNPMLAQIPHLLLAAHAGTIMGVETNAMQFYPDASRPEEAVHPGMYRRRNGQVDLSTVNGPGFGYRLEEIDRELPAPAVEYINS
jgi:L-alanine-DL-glutamate epimerase-like enolase superfamily enzyme